MDKMSIYNMLPVCLQNVACTVEGMRVKRNKYGKRQQKALSAFMERNNWTYKQKCEYRDQQLQIMMEHCYNHVPYYRKMFDRLGVDYHTIKSLDDLGVLPILTKSIVKENFDDFLADNVDPKELIPMHTSGTTGSSFHFYYTKSAYAAQWADKVRHDFNLGLSGKEWAAYFGGRSIVPKSKNKPPFYRINYAMKEVLFSAFHLSASNFDDYIRGLERFKPEFWHGYPSSMVPLAQYLLDTGKCLSFVPKCIQLSSENVSESQLLKMKEAFGIRPIQGYALTEQVATFREYTNGRIFVTEDISAVELIPVQGSDLFRVVGTTITNFGMPLIRYDTKDFVTFIETPEGRQILSIDGREEDCVRFKDGTIMRRLSRIFHDQKNVVESQIIQHSYDLLEFLVVKGKNFTRVDEEMLHRDIQEYLTGKIGYEVKYVEAIPKTANGKIKFIISEIEA